MVAGGGRRKSVAAAPTAFQTSAAAAPAAEAEAEAKTEPKVDEERLDVTLTREVARGSLGIGIDLWDGQVRCRI